MFVNIACKDRKAVATSPDRPTLKLIAKGASNSEAVAQLLNSVMQCDDPSITLLCDPDMPGYEMVLSQFPEDGFYQMRVFGIETFREVNLGWQ